MANELAGQGTVHQFAGPELGLGVSRQNTRKKIKCWTEKQHMAMWWGLISTQRQAPKLILGPSLSAKTRILSFYTIQSRVVTSLLTGHNTLKRHPYIIGPIKSPLCKGCGAEVEVSALVL
jgi:hypothetical protein